MAKEENNSEEEEDNVNETENANCRVTLNVDESLGKYLMSYVNIMKVQMTNQESMFQIFDETA